jgi:GxxExxY protein
MRRAIRPDLSRLRKLAGRKRPPLIMDVNDLTSKIISAAMTVHSSIGPGLLESVYQECLRIELEHMGIRVETEVAVPVVYRDKEISDNGFRIDALVEDTVIVELKSVEEVKPVHKKQLLTYLRLTGKQVGLLINFNEALLKNGITRVANNYSPAPK